MSSEVSIFLKVIAYALSFRLNKPPLVFESSTHPSFIHFNKIAPKKSSLFSINYNLQLSNKLEKYLHYKEYP